MFGRKTRQQVADLKARIQRLIEERDQYKAQAAAAQAVTSRIAAKFRENHTLGWSEAGRLDEHIDGLGEYIDTLKNRRARILNACARYRADAAQLQEQVVALRHELDDLKCPPDRAPLARPAAVERELQDLRALLKAKEDQLGALRDELARSEATRTSQPKAAA